MSKERELLKRWLAGEANQIPTHVPLLIETQNLLAQPEALAPEREFIRLWYENIELWKVHAKEPEQEPVAWMNESGGCFLSDGNKYSDLWTPLYTAPPKREPLSDDEMRAIWKEGIRGEIPFVEIGRAIEKAHGITGGGE